jgi:hypothetical protein
VNGAAENRETEFTIALKMSGQRKFTIVVSIVQALHLLQITVVNQNRFNRGTPAAIGHQPSLDQDDPQVPLSLAIS